MSALIERPSFYEGQILGAADLESGAAHARGQLARHERYLHLWGIAHGLVLQATPKKTADDADYQEIVLTAGIAIDGTGREIVVPDATALVEDTFEQLNVAINAADAWYPVFVSGRDAPAPVPALGVRMCGVAQPVRTSEAYAIDFGRPGDERAEYDASAVSDGAGGSSADRPWRVLLGFVQWDSQIRKFKALAFEREGVRPTYAGVQADRVCARGGALVLRTRVDAKAAKPAVLLTETDGGELQFGLQSASGLVKPVFTVTAKGDVIAAGTVTSALTTGIYVESGLASDGMQIPLPQGIEQAQVDEGKAILHIHLTPRFQNDPHLPGTNYMQTHSECRVEGRRVFCRTVWFRFGGAPRTIDLPGTCDYTVVAVVSTPAGGNP